MNDSDFKEYVVGALATMQTNIKWIIKLGGGIVLLCGLGLGSLWIRTEINTISIAEAQTIVMPIETEVK